MPRCHWLRRLWDGMDEPRKGVALAHAAPPTQAPPPALRWRAVPDYVPPTLADLRTLRKGGGGKIVPRAARPPGLRLYSVTFPGRYLNAYAVVIAESREHAAALLRAARAADGLTQYVALPDGSQRLVPDASPADFEEIDLTRPAAHILSDGDY